MPRRGALVPAAVLTIAAAAALVFLMRRSGDMTESRQPAADKERSQGAPEASRDAPVESPFAGETGILILKERRLLVYYENGEERMRCRIGLGFAPAGDKEVEGDGKTPEGGFYICVKNPRSRYHLSLGLSYPNEEDAARGLAAGLIAREEREEIVAAIRGRRQPPWKTALGGEIFIHGAGSRSDWTLGCIALDDPEIERLYELVGLGTPVIIRP